MTVSRSARFAAWDSIDGSKWAGLKREDILMKYGSPLSLTQEVLHPSTELTLLRHSVLNTYKSNGNTNKPASLDLSTEEAIAGLYDADITKAKGLISIPICSFDEAITDAKDGKKSLPVVIMMSGADIEDTGIDENNVNWPCSAP